MAAAAAEAAAGNSEETTKKHMLVVGGNQLVSVFDIYTGATLLKMQRDGRVRCVALSNDGSALVVGGFDRKVVLHPKPQPSANSSPNPAPAPVPTPTLTKQGRAARRGRGRAALHLRAAHRGRRALGAPPERREP